MPMNLADIIPIRRIEEFPGHQKFRQKFQRNLILPPQNRYYIFNIFGEPRTGKTFLLNDFLNIASKKKVFTAVVNESTTDVPSVMGQICESFYDFGVTYPMLSDLYDKYTRLKGGLVSSPNAPRGIKPYLKDLIGCELKIPTDFRLFSGSELCETIDASRVDQDFNNLLEGLEKEQLQEYINDTIEFICREILDPNDLRLVENPISEMTLNFLNGLETIGRKTSIVLFFDDYHLIGSFVDNWLRTMITREKYGKSLPHNTVLVISGETRLNREKWNFLDSFIFDIKLTKFTEKEIKIILASKEISDNETCEMLFTLTGGMPLYFKKLLEQLVKDSIDNTPKKNEALDFFFGNLSSHQKHQCLELAVPRIINKSVINSLISSKSQKNVFDWLIGLPFVVYRTNAYIYLPSVRQSIINYRMQNSPNDLQQTHLRMIDFYRGSMSTTEDDAIDISIHKIRSLDTREKEELEKRFLELIYHRAFVMDGDIVSDATNIFLETFIDSPKFSSAIVDSLSQAAVEAGIDAVENYCKKLKQILVRYEEKDFRRLCESLDQLSEQADFPNSRVFALVSDLKNDLNDSFMQGEDLELSTLESSSDEYQERLKLFGVLAKVPPPQFEQILFSIQPPAGVIPPSSAAQGDRVSALLQWCETSEACNLAMIHKLLKDISG
jgi:hypothetical protein